MSGKPTLLSSQKENIGGTQRYAQLAAKSESPHLMIGQPDENAPERPPSAYVLFSNSKSCGQECEVLA
jgi:hypothetical protein